MSDPIERSPPGFPAPYEPPRVEGASEAELSAEEVHSRSEAEREEFGALYKRIRRELLAFARRFVGPSADAEDLVQDVVLAAWTNETIDQFGGDDERSKRYLWRAIRNRWSNKRRDHERFTNRLARYVGFIVTSATGIETPWQDTELHELEWHLDRALEKLTPRCREAFELVCLFDMKYAEAAAELGMSIHTLSAHITKANKFVRRELAKVYGVELRARGEEKEDMQ